jgi:hypothetical protein
MEDGWCSRRRASTRDRRLIQAVRRPVDRGGTPAIVFRSAGVVGSVREDGADVVCGIRLVRPAGIRVRQVEPPEFVNGAGALDWKSQPA